MYVGVVLPKFRQKQVEGFLEIANLWNTKTFDKDAETFRRYITTAYFLNEDSSGKRTPDTFKEISDKVERYIKENKLS